MFRKTSAPILSPILACAGLGLWAPAEVFAQDDVVDTAPSHSASFRMAVGAQAILGTFSFGDFGQIYSPGSAFTFLFDADAFRVEAMAYLFAAENGLTAFGLGGRFGYVVHQTKRADLALTGALAVIHADAGPGDATRVHFEGGMQARVFLGDNFALTAAAGLGLGFGDGGYIVSLGGQTTGTFGFLYFF